MTPRYHMDDPFGQPFGSIEHYYGDVVRMLFMGIAILVSLSIPFNYSVSVDVIFRVVAILILVGLAAFTNPHSRIVIVLDAVAAGFGLLAGEVLAIGTYGQNQFVAFAVLECVCVLFLAAFYFSVKTVRAMTMNQIGKDSAADEFELDEEAEVEG